MLPSTYPPSVLAKNFGLDPEIFKHVHIEERYVFQGDKDDKMPDKEVIKRSKLMITHKMLDQKPEKFSGEVRITDTEKFTLSKTVSAARVTESERRTSILTQTNGLFSSEAVRESVFASSRTARTFNLSAQNVGIVLKSIGHYQRGGGG